MRINSINNNINFGYNNGLTKTASYQSGDIDILDRIDYDRIINTLQSKESIVDKKTTPIKFFTLSLFLSLGAALIGRKASFSALKAMDGKFPLFTAADSTSKTVVKKLDNLERQMPKLKQDKTAKTYFIDRGRKLISKFYQYGKKGLKVDALKPEFKKSERKVLIAKNSLSKILANVFGLSIGSCTAIEQYKDRDNNGIPDKNEKTLVKLNAFQQGFTMIPDIIDALNC